MDTQYRNFYSMGTRLDAVFIGIDDKDADSITVSIRKELDKLEDILSIYRSDSELSKLNRSAYKSNTRVSRTLLEAVMICKDYHSITSGVYDAGMAGLTGGRAGRGKAGHIAAMPGSSGIDLVEINEAESTISYHGENVRIDPGGFGKGLAMKRVKEILVAGGIPDALISFGESSILALGAHPHGSYWPVAVASIFDRHRVARVAMLRDKSLSTSGTGFVDSSGMFKPYCNIIDPRTGKAPDDPRTVSFVSDDPLEAEIMSTSLLIDSQCLPEDFVRSGKEAFAVEYDSPDNFIVREIL